MKEIKELINLCPPEKKGLIKRYFRKIPKNNFREEDTKIH